jgi:hypothetical protein
MNFTGTIFILSFEGAEKTTKAIRKESKSLRIIKILK